MKKTAKICILMCSCLLSIIGCILSSEANPRYILASIMSGSQGYQGNMIFSKDSGFYDKEFELKIYAPTDEIYYTLDGSDPDRNSIKYEGSILIYDATENPNVYSSRTDVTAAFLEEEIEKYGAGKGEYQIPEDSVDKCVVLKAVYYDKSGNCSDIEERIYFVGFDEKEGYEGMHIVSIVSDPENLFGYEKGIYVLGETSDTFLKDGIAEDYWARQYWAFWDANYRNKGIEWERESHIQIFDEDHQLVASQNIGIRIQGGGSRGFYPKSLNLYARDEYGSNKIYYDFWGTGYYPKRMTLTMGGDDQYSKAEDRLVSELVKECNIVTMNYVPCVLFLNGEYWGVYHMTEKYDEHYIEHYYGVDKGELIDDIIMIKNGSVETGVEADYYVSYSEMMEFVTTADMEVEENYQKACELLDIESFIDYFAVEGYIARCGDWPSSNFALWRSRNVSEKPYEDGKWRWILFDVNSSSMEEAMLPMDAIESMRSNSEMFDNLCNNESFRKSFAARLLELSDTVFDTERVTEKIEALTEELAGPMEKNFQRFFGTSNERFYERMSELQTFFENRRPYILDSIEKNFGEEYLLSPVEEN